MLLLLNKVEELPKEGTDEQTDVELLKDIKTLLEEYKKEREDAKASTQQEVVATDDQLQLMKQQVAIQTEQLAWIQIAICLGAVFVIARGLYKLIASYLW